MATEQQWTDYAAAKVAMIQSGLGEFHEQVLPGSQHYAPFLYSTLSTVVDSDAEVAELALPYVELALELKAEVSVLPILSTGRINIRLTKSFDLTQEEYEQQLALKN